MSFTHIHKIHEYSFHLHTHTYIHLTYCITIEVSSRILSYTLTYIFYHTFFRTFLSFVRQIFFSSKKRKETKQTLLLLTHFGYMNTCTHTYTKKTSPNIYSSNQRTHILFSPTFHTFVFSLISKSINH